MKNKKDKSRIKFKWWACIVIMVLAVLLIPAAKAGAASPTMIDSSTFRRATSISTIHIGSDVEEITAEAFRGLMSLRSITVSENNPYFTSYSNCLYNKDMTELLCFPPALKGAMIPSTAVSIRENALYGVDEKLKAQIKQVIHQQESGSRPEADVPGEHFVHTAEGLKWKNSDGSLRSPDTELMILVASVIESSTTADMTRKEELERCFDYLVRTTSYEKKINVPLGDWPSEYAKEILGTGKGNFYNYASAFAYVAKGLGYDAKVVTGTIASGEGGRRPHAWTEVKVGDNWYIFDAQMQKVMGSGFYQVGYDSYPMGPITAQASITIAY